TWPGVGVEGSIFLADQNPVAVGADTLGTEVHPAEKEGEFVPVHQELIVKRGIYLLENMVTAELVADEAWEFLFTLGPARFKGAVQMIINPIAVR
ncbi:MAG: cyclase family protein, partial [Akkermansiaceae bacterium]|nr:cyclase family protein [Akkermansiaceae bacterium]